LWKIFEPLCQVLKIAVVLHFGQKTKFHKCIKCVATEDGIEKNKWVILTRFFVEQKYYLNFTKESFFLKANHL